MKMLPQVLFWLGLISVPFAWLVWYFGPGIEIIRPVLGGCPAFLLNIEKRSLPRLMLSGDGLASKDAV